MIQMKEHFALTRDHRKSLPIEDDWTCSEAELFMQSLGVPSIFYVIL